MNISKSYGGLWIKLSKTWSIGITSNKDRVNTTKGFGKQTGSNNGIKLWTSWNAMMPFYGFHVNKSYTYKNNE